MTTDESDAEDDRLLARDDLGALFARHYDDLVVHARMRMGVAGAEDVVPDIQVVAKGLGGGYQPIGGILARRRVVDGLASGSGALAHGHTYQAHPIACAAALAVQEAIAEEAPWTRPVHWVGIVREKKDVGWKVRMYAGRKRMFKGHLWERKREGIIRKRSILMRDMAARVRRYKEVSFAAFALFLLEAHSLFCSVLQKENTQPPQAFQILEGTQTSLLVLSYFIIHVYLQSLAGSLSILMWTRGSTTRNSILPSEDTKYYVKVYCTNRVTTRG